MTPYSQICNVCNACNASLLLAASSIFLGKCLCIQEKLRKETVRSISRQETLSRIVANAANRTEIISPANEQYENRSKLLRYPYKRAASNASVTNSAVMSINLSIYFRIRKFSQILHAFCIYVQ